MLKTKTDMDRVKYLEDQIHYLIYSRMKTLQKFSSNDFKDKVDFLNYLSNMVSDLSETIKEAVKGYKLAEAIKGEFLDKLKEDAFENLESFVETLEEENEEVLSYIDLYKKTKPYEKE